MARRSSFTSCLSALIRARSSHDVPALRPSSTSARLTHLRTVSTPYPSWSATRWIVPCSVPSSRRSWRTSRTAWAFSSSEYRRVVGLPGLISFGMTPSSFPRSGASNNPGRFTPRQDSWCRYASLGDDQADLVADSHTAERDALGQILDTC